MRYIEKQRRIEDLVFEAIDEIAEELEIEVPFYPEVYWLGRGVEFEFLGLPKTYKNDFLETKNNKAGIYFNKEKVILIAKDCSSYIGEEASHFLHHKSSKITARGKSKMNRISANILIEMFGYLGSKIVNPARINPYRNSPDLLFSTSYETNKFKARMKKIYGEDEAFLDDFIIHQQGYGLGERLFLKYARGEIEMKRIKKIFLNPLIKSNEPTIEFIRLRDELWPIDNLKTSNSLV